MSSRTWLILALYALFFLSVPAVTAQGDPSESGGDATVAPHERPAEAHDEDLTAGDDGGSAGGVDAGDDVEEGVIAPDVVETYLPTDEMAARGEWHTRQVRRGRDTQEFVYMDIDGKHIVEGDIVLDDELFELMSADSDNTTSLLGDVWYQIGNQRRWPCPVPYRIQAGYTNPALITAAIAEVERMTSWQFVVRTTETDFMNFVTSGGCSSFVGRLGGSQNVWINPTGCPKASVMHEIMHALGVWHEQSRDDRDDYITISAPDIIPGTEGNFAIAANQLTVGPYDFNSVMHYGRWAFSSTGNPTITPLGDLANQEVCLIGQRDTFSPGDVETARQRWSSSAQCGIYAREQPAYEVCDAGDFQLCGYADRPNSQFFNGYYRLLLGTTNSRPRWQKLGRENVMQTRVYAYWLATTSRWVVGTTLGSSGGLFARALGSATAATPGHATSWEVWTGAGGWVLQPDVYGRECTDCTEPLNEFWPLSSGVNTGGGTVANNWARGYDFDLNVRAFQITRFGVAPGSDGLYYVALWNHDTQRILSTDYIHATANEWLWFDLRPAIQVNDASRWSVILYAFAGQTYKWRGGGSINTDPDIDYVQMRFHNSQGIYVWPASTLSNSYTYGFVDICHTDACVDSLHGVDTSGFASNAFQNHQRGYRFTVNRFFDVNALGISPAAWGDYIVSLWNANTAERLSYVVMESVRPDVWQSEPLETPIQLTPGVTYVVSGMGLTAGTQYRFVNDNSFADDDPDINYLGTVFCNSCDADVLPTSLLSTYTYGFVDICHS